MFETDTQRANRAIEEEIDKPRKAVEWPKPLAAEGFHGLSGQLVDVLSPHSEADPISLLTNNLIVFGNVIGRGPHFIAEADKHFTNVNIVQVGKTSKGRKGSAFGQIRRLYEQIEHGWVNSNIQSGLSSGEGLIWAVRDPIEKSMPQKEKGKITSYELQVVDPGIQDKRLLVLESELASTLRVLRREGNTLSAIIRQAWDSGNLSSLTKNSPAKAHGAHISISGHITQDELLRYLDDTEVGNGFANRFLWVCVKRSKLLPEGSSPDETKLQSLVEHLRDAVEFSRKVGEMERDENARQAWLEVYPKLSEGKPGLVGSLMARAEAQTMRFACLYALLDLSAVIRREHLLASLALLDYCEASVYYIFGNKLGDPIADVIANALSISGQGLTRTEISELFGKHQTAARISQALNELAALGRAKSVAEETEGRSTERWFTV